MENSSSQSPETSGMQNQQKTLLHILGRETRIVVKNASEVDDKDFFSSQYKSALQIVASIVDNQKDDDDDYDNIENFNNIITFIGDRGSGKTSCMLTFANLLKKPDEIKIKSSDQNEHIEKLKKYQFCVLPAIDPSFFVSAYNIIGAFIANIYNQFRKEASKNCHTTGDVDEGVIQNFYAALSKAQRSFGRLYSEKRDDMDDMERLEQLSCSLNLKEDIENLTNAYLCYMNRCSNVRYSKLVLCIDDIDLNTKTAVEIMEWIRKYLIQPNIIILFAVKLDQMFDLKRMNLYAEYKDLLDKKKISDTEIDEMTEKYITKTFPLAHRVHLPDSNLIFNTVYTSKTEYTNQENKNENDEKKIRDVVKEMMHNCKFYEENNTNKEQNSDKNKEEKTIRDIVVEEIYNKTRYLFYNKELETNLIVPNNLRDVLYLMRLLHEMEEVPGKKDTTNDKNNRNDILKRNQRIFKNYFFNNWINKNLDSESRDQINDLLKNAGTDQLNGRVLRIVKKRCETILEYKQFDEFSQQYKDSILKEISYVLNDRNNTYNISMGDTMWIINWLYNMVRSREETYFLFAVKTIYSIKLFEYYDEMSDRRIKTVYQKSPEKGKNHLHVTDNFINKDNYHLLLNGQFFNQTLSCFYIAEGRENKEVTLKNRWIKVETLSKALNDYKTGDTNEANEIKGKILEFIMLCASIHYSGNKINDDKLYRMKPHARYSLPIGKRRELVKFDICTFFYNITDIESCYNRFKLLFDEEEYFNSFINRDNALWREFIYASKEPTCDNNNKLLSEEFNNKESYNPGYYTKNTTCESNNKDTNKIDLENLTCEDWHNWLSWVCIRNIEVYQDFIEHMESRREHTSSPSILETIKTVFENISCFNMRTHRDELDTRGINFSWAQIIVSLFENIEKHDNDKKLFEVLLEELPQDENQQGDKNKKEPYLVSSGVKYFFKNSRRKID